MFLNLRRNIYFSKGIARSAIYDLNKTIIFWLSVEETQVLTEILFSDGNVDNIDWRDDGFIGSLLKHELVTIEASPKDHNQHLRLQPERSIGHAWIELDTGCNHKCHHCYNFSAPHKAEKLLDISRLKRALEELKRAGAKRITFIGGEPLLYKESLRLLIIYAVGLHFDSINVCTNATLIDDDLASFFYRYGVSSSVSIYGHLPALHESVTKAEGSFNDTCAGIENLLKNKCHVRLNVIVTPANEVELPVIIPALKQRFPLASVGYDYLRPTGRGVLLYRQLSLKYLNRFRELDTFFDGIDELTFLTNKFYHPCLHDKIMVNGAGEISSCIMLRNNVGNLSKDSVNDIVNSAAFKEVKELSMSKLETCVDCEFKFACTDCRPIAVGITKNLYSKPPECNYDPYTGIYNPKT